MKDDSITPDPAQGDSDSDAKVYASIGSLKVGEEGVAPEIGDEVELTVKGKVDSIDGDVVCVTPTEVNGEPSPAPSGAGDENPDAERERLLQQVESHDPYSA